MREMIDKMIDKMNGCQAKALKDALINPKTNDHGIIMMSPEFRDLILPYIEIQIPKSVEIHFGRYCCPECSQLLYGGETTCRACKQALDWSGTE